jgi:hypothetical protein
MIKSKRYSVFAKDNFQCVSCYSSENIEVDHIIPNICGGSDNMDNLQTLCAKCNTLKLINGKGWVEYESVKHSTWAAIPKDIQGVLMGIGEDMLGIQFNAPVKKDIQNDVLGIIFEHH